jgi:RimJ/RimL family protein N-acetyltransferase
VIADAADAGPLGLVSLRIAERDPGLAAVGYWLRPEARGRGAATVAVQLIARWAFDELGVERLELTTAPENVTSQRVAERAGFTREGVLRGLQRRSTAGVRTP